jgi:hypothetical protein
MPIDDQLLAKIMGRLARKEEARSVARNVLDAEVGSDRRTSGSVGTFLCSNDNAGRPEIRNDCMVTDFSCPGPNAQGFGCPVMFYDCGTFFCKPASFQCKQNQTTGGRDFVCASSNKCLGKFTCNRDHGYYCIASDECAKQFSCNNSDGVKGCVGETDLNTYNRWGDKVSGDFACGQSGVTGPGGPRLPEGSGFTCVKTFSCETYDEFECGLTNAATSKFSCMSTDKSGWFTCSSAKKQAFQCNPGYKPDENGHTYACSGGMLGSYSHLEK